MARSRKEDATLVRLPMGLQNVEHAVMHEGYDVTVRECCRALKCSRGYFDEHLRPHVHHIYVPDLWARALVRRVGGLELASTYYNREELDQVVHSAVVERRSRVVWFTEAVDARTRAELIGRLELVAMECDEVEGEIARLDLVEAAALDLVALLKARLDGAWLRARETARWERQRTRAHWVAVGDRPPLDLAEVEAAWTTAAAMKGYGDTDEGVQRDIWRGGMVRVELAMPDGARRVMYAPDPTAECPPPDLPTSTYARAAAAVLSAAVAVDALPGAYVDSMVDR